MPDSAAAAALASLCNFCKAISAADFVGSVTQSAPPPPPATLVDDVAFDDFDDISMSVPEAAPSVLPTLRLGTRCVVAATTLFFAWRIEALISSFDMSASILCLEDGRFVAGFSPST